eukprot:SAG31_NODE_12535_length_934_cov_0.988024_1_plen_161_part_00
MLATASALVSFKGGMQTLTDALVSSIRETGGMNSVLLGSPAVSLSFGRGTSRQSTGEGGGGSVSVALADGTTVTGDHVFMALPAKPAAALLAPHSAVLAGKLDTIEYADMVLVTLAWDKDVLPKELVGFGHLVRTKSYDQSFFLLKYWFRKLSRSHCTVR